jgi:O-antigen/teichoic acid export membrane protein
MLGNDKVALYSVPYLVGTALNLIIVTINASWIPFTLTKMKEKKYKDIGVYSNYLILGCAAICIMIVILAPEIMMVLAPPAYYEATQVIAPVVIGVYFTFIYSLFSNIEFYYKKTVPVMIASVTAALLNVVLNLIFIPKFGYMAAGYTTLIGYFTLTIMHYIFMKKVHVSNIYNIKSIIITSIILILLSLIAIQIYKYIFIRYILLIFILLCLIILYKGLKENI